MQVKPHTRRIAHAGRESERSMREAYLKRITLTLPGRRSFRKGPPGPIQTLADVTQRRSAVHPS